MRLTQKLLSFLNRVFEKDPKPFLVLRLRYAGGMTWEVADGRLRTAVSGGPGQNLDLDLSQYTIGSLVSHLVTMPGYSVSYADTSGLSLMSALVLMDGSNDIALSNGDHLYGYTSVLWSYLEASANELGRAEVQIGEMLKQMSTTTAVGEWLDEIGGYYGIPRNPGELDDSYGPRIIAEVLRPRANNVAMEAAIKVYTGQDTKVTDVTLYGDTFPLHNGAITHNAAYQYNANAKPIYGLFDVEYAYDLQSGQDIDQYKTTIIGIIDRLRDAGTHLRSLLLRASEMSDDAAAPSDAFGVMNAGMVTSDNAAVPTETTTMALALGALSDTATPGSDADDVLTVDYYYQHNAIRSYNGAILHLGFVTNVERMDGTVVSSSNVGESLSLDFGSDSYGVVTS